MTQPQTSPPVDEAERYFAQERQAYPYGRGYAEWEAIPSGGVTLQQLREKTMPGEVLQEEDVSLIPRRPLPGEYLPLPGEELSVDDIIRRYAARR